MCLMNTSGLRDLMINFPFTFDFVTANREPPGVCCLRYVCAEQCTAEVQLFAMEGNAEWSQASAVAAVVESIAGYRPSPKLICEYNDEIIIKKDNEKLPWLASMVPADTDGDGSLS